MKDANDYLAEKVQKLENEITVSRISFEWWKSQALRGKSMEEIHEIEQKANSANVYL